MRLQIEINGQEITDEDREKIKDIVNVAIEAFMLACAKKNAPVWMGFSALAVACSNVLAMMANSESDAKVLRDDMLHCLSTQIESVFRQRAAIAAAEAGGEGKMMQ